MFFLPRPRPGTANQKKRFWLLYQGWLVSGMQRRGIDSREALQRMQGRGKDSKRRRNKGADSSRGGQQPDSQGRGKRGRRQEKRQSRRPVHSRICEAPSDVQEKRGRLVRKRSHPLFPGSSGR